MRGLQRAIAGTCGGIEVFSLRFNALQADLLSQMSATWDTVLVPLIGRCLIRHCGGSQTTRSRQWRLEP